MKRKIAALLLCGILAFSMAACGAGNQPQGGQGENETESQETQDSESGETGSTQDVGTDASTGTEAPQAAGEQSSGNHVLIAYFSIPEDIDISGIDADAGASVVVKDGEALGNVQFMAQTIQETIGGDLFRIETTQQYPLDHDPLVDQAAEEQDADARPELSSHIENLEQYDTVFLGYPNWWGDMPQPLYTFLEEYDFSGKTIIPFCPHGGSGFSRTESTIAGLQPGADVSSNGFSISRNDVADSADEVAEWAQSLVH
ncbi:MAG: flavodoxin [Ruminococcus sp.]|nr:flavodoxin [Ruminococcus sp.]